MVRADVSVRAAELKRQFIATLQDGQTYPELDPDYAVPPSARNPAQNATPSKTRRTLSQPRGTSLTKLLPGPTAAISNSLSCGKFNETCEKLLIDKLCTRIAFGDGRFAVIFHFPKAATPACLS